MLLDVKPPPPPTAPFPQWEFLISYIFIISNFKLIAPDLIIYFNHIFNDVCYNFDEN